ncbi:MAG: LuxR C-terminal-related transcriptional regulator [Bacteroidota bacterium]
MRSNLTYTEINNISGQQVFTLERKIQNGEFSIESVGDYLPGNVLVTDLSKLSTLYMNKSGCNILKQSVEELNELGPEYFQQFFVPEEMNVFVSTYLNMQQQQDASGIYNFAHRVKTMSDESYKWYFASAKLLYTPGQHVSDKMLLIVNEVNSLGNIAKKINSVLEESDWMKANFKKLCRLSKREKEILGLLASGYSTAQISDAYCLSKLTVNTHRRNIIQKLEVKTFAGLYKFAVAFGLCSF